MTVDSKFLDIMSTAFVTFKTHGLDVFHFNQLPHGGALHCQEALGFKKFAKDRAKTDRARTLRGVIHILVAIHFA